MKIIAFFMMLCLCNVFAQEVELTSSLVGLTFVGRAFLGDSQNSVITFKIKNLIKIDENINYEFSTGDLVENGIIELNTDYIIFKSQTFEIPVNLEEFNKAVKNHVLKNDDIRIDQQRFIATRILTNYQFIGSSLIIISNEIQGNLRFLESVAFDTGYAGVAGLEPQSWVNGYGTSYIYFGSGEFDGQASGHDYFSTLYMPSSGFVNNCDGGRSHTYCDYRQE